MADKVYPAQRTRAWWFDRHGLNATKGPKTIRDCLRRAGWLPTPGSTGVYLSIRARMPRVSRAAIDRAAKRVVTRIWHTNKGLGARVAAEADETCRFIREHIGDAKISAVDPPSRRARRIAFCRA
jgi:hypothetical protein